MKSTITTTISFILVAFAATFANGAVECCQQEGGQLDEDPLCTFNDNLFERINFSTEYCECRSGSNDVDECVDCCRDEYRDNRDERCGANSLELFRSHNQQVLVCGMGCVEDCRTECFARRSTCFEPCFDGTYREQQGGSPFVDLTRCTVPCINAFDLCEQRCDRADARVNSFADVLLM